jgi:hypothetical protein
MSKEQLEGEKLIYTDEIREGVIIGMKNGIIIVGTKKENQLTGNELEFV